MHFDWLCFRAPLTRRNCGQFTAALNNNRYLLKPNRVFGSYIFQTWNPALRRWRLLKRRDSTAYSNILYTITKCQVFRSRFCKLYFALFHFRTNLKRIELKKTKFSSISSSQVFDNFWNIIQNFRIFFYINEEISSLQFSRVLSIDHITANIMQQSFLLCD